MDSNLDPNWPDNTIFPGPSDAWHEGWRRRLGARRVSAGPSDILKRPSDMLLGSGLPSMLMGGLGLPQPMRANWSNMMIGPLSVGAGGAGGSGTGTVEQVIAGTAISVSPGSSGASTYTVTGAYTAGALISITADEIASTLTAGSNLSFTGDQLNAADQTPTAGYGVRIDGTREVNVDMRVMTTYVLINATYDGVSTITTGVAPGVTSPPNNQYRYKGVPVKITALTVTGGNAYSVTIAADDTEPFAYGTVWSGTHVDVYNIPTNANTATFRGVGVNIGATDFPAGYDDMGIGEKRDTSGGPSTWESMIVRCDRYDLGGGNYRWIMCENPDFDGSCSQGDAYYSSLPEVLTAAEF